MNLRVKTSAVPIEDAGLGKVASLRSGLDVYANIKDALLTVELKDKRRVHIFGDVFYYILTDGKIKTLESGGKEFLSKIFGENPLPEIIRRLEGQYVALLVDDTRQTVTFFSDRYARCDCFYAAEGNNLYLSGELDFIFANVKPQYDQAMLGHLFSTYGWYTPKGHTIYSNAKQLRVGEIIELSDAGIESQNIGFEPLKIEDFSHDHLETYYEILADSVAARSAGADRVWVSSSSGWDSSMILALLVDKLGPSKVGMITGSMQYSDNTATINQFEIDKTKKIGEFYGIKPHIVDMDMTSPKAGEYWAGIIGHYKSRHIYSSATFNFAKISDGLGDVADPASIVFNGEMSDSLHNFGFSQFATFFHTKKCFTEYADKMNCYLYSPSFLAKVLDGSYEKDRVYKIFKAMMPGVEFSAGDGSPEDLIERFLFPFFHGSPRIPMAITHKNPAFTQKAEAAAFSFPYRQYMPDVLSGMNPENIYSWLIYLYHSFHSQGSTVGVHKHSMDRNGYRWRSPFNDYRLIDLLSRAPESWGRGLELNNTKYPLKWAAKNKIKFPYDLLDQGPHSYLYDVIEGFSLSAEATYRSAAVKFFKDALADRGYRQLLSDEHFDIAYLDKLTTDYLDGKETTGRDFNNLVSLITLSMTGWY